MNTVEVRQHAERQATTNGEYKIPFLVVCDAFQSEMIAFADLVLPDTTYLERHDVMSMLDRPISEFDGPVDSVRVPVVPPTGECKPFQEVLIELAGPPEAAGVRQRRRRAQVPGLPRLHRQLRDRARLGHRLPRPAGAARTATSSCRARPTRSQWEMYAENNCVFHHQLPPSLPVHAQLEPGLPRVGAAHAPAPLRRPDRDPALLRGAADVPPRGAGQARRDGSRPQHLRERIETYFDPLPFWYPPLEAQATDRARYPLAAITQRPMAMYHSWDSQNAWLRQIHAHNYLFVNPATRARRAASPTAAGSGSSRRGASVRCMARY